MIQIVSMNKKDFKPKGPYAAMAVPFKEDGTVDEAVLRQEVEFLVNSGISGLFPCGSTGEFIHLSIEENCRIMDIVADQAKGRMDIVPGTCTSTIDSTLRLIENAERLGCPAVVICPPYYITLSQDSIVKYFQTIARAVNTKIILYNIPMFTNEIAMSTFQKLISEENIIGIKDSSANMKKIMHYIQFSREERPDFSVMTGTDEILLPALAGGCVGSMTALSGIVPEINMRIYKAFNDKDYNTAQSLQLSTIKLIRLAESLTFPAGYKLILEKRGFKMGRSKQVVVELGTEAYRNLESEIEKELIKLLGDKVEINK